MKIHFERKLILILLLPALPFIAVAQTSGTFPADYDMPTTTLSPLPRDLQPLFDLRMRDTSICLGGDGMYYLTGTTGDNIWVENQGIELWRSPDLKTWDKIGLVWSIERDGTWQKRWTKKRGRDGAEYDRRVVWAPEIHFVKNNYWICYCVPGSGMGTGPGIAAA